MSESGRYSDGESAWSTNARPSKDRNMQEKLSQGVKQRRRRSASFHNVYIASSTDSYSNHEKFDKKRKAIPYNVGDVSNLKKAWKITSSASNLQAKALRSLQKEKEILQSFGSLSLTCYHNRSNGKEKATKDEHPQRVDEDILKSSVKPVLHASFMDSYPPHYPPQFTDEPSSSLPEGCPMTRPSDCPIICLPKPKSSKPQYYHIEEEAASTFNAPFPEYDEKLPRGCTKKRREDCDDRCKARARASKIKQSIASKFENPRYADYFDETMPRGCKKKRRSSCDQRCKDKFTPSLVTNVRANTLNQEFYPEENVPKGCPMKSRSECIDRCRNKLRGFISPFHDEISRDHASIVNQGFRNGQLPPGCVKKDISQCDDRCRTKFRTLYKDPEYDEIAKYQAGKLGHSYHFDSDVPEGCPMRSRSECSDKCTGKRGKKNKMMQPMLQQIQPKIAKTLASENVPPGGQNMPLGCPFTRREDCDRECREGDFKFDETVTQQKIETLQQAYASDNDRKLPPNCPLKQRRECPERSNPINTSSSLRILEDKVNEHITEPQQAQSTKSAFKDGPNVKATSITGLGKYTSNLQKGKYRVSFPPGLIKSDLTLAKLRKKKDFLGMAARRASDSAVNAVRRQKKRESAKRVALPSLKHSRGSHHGGYGHMLGPGEISSGDGEIQTCGLPKCVQEARARAKRRLTKNQKPGDRENATPDVFQLLTKRPSDNVITRISSKKRADRRAGRPKARRHPWPHSSYSEHRSCGRSGVLKYNEGLAKQIKLSPSFVERLKTLRGIHSDDEDEDYITTVGSPVAVGKPVVLIGRLHKPDGTHTQVVILGTVRIRIKERNMYASGDSVATLPSVHLPRAIDIKAEGYAIENITKPEVVSGDAEGVIAKTQVATQETGAPNYEKVGYFDTIKKAADNFFGKFTKKDGSPHPYVCSKAVAMYDTTYQAMAQGPFTDSNIPVVIGRGRQVEQQRRKEEKMSKSGLKFLSNVPNFKEDEFCASNKLSNKMRVFRHEIRDVTGDQIHHMKAFPGGQETYNKDKLTHKMEFFRQNIREGEDGRLRKWRGGEEGWSPKKQKSPIPSQDMSLTEVVDPKTMKPQPDTVKINLKSLRRSSRPDLLTPKNTYVEDYGDYNAHDGALWRRGDGASSYSNSSFYKRLSQVAKNLKDLKNRNRGEEDIFGSVGGNSEPFTCYHIYDDIENAIERHEADEQMLYDDQGSEEDYGEVTTVEETYESVEFSEDDTGQPDEDELESFGEESSESGESEDRSEEESFSISPPTGTTSSFPVPSSGIKTNFKQPKKHCRFYGFSQNAKKMQKLIIGKINKNKSKNEKQHVPSLSAGCDISDKDYHNKNFYKRIYYAMNKFTDKMFQMLPFDHRSEETISSRPDTSSSILDSSNDSTNRPLFTKKKNRNVKRKISFYWSKAPITTSLPLYEHKAVKEEMQHVRRTLFHVTEQALADNKKKTLKTYRYSRSVSIPEARQPLKIFPQQKPILPSSANQTGRSKVVIGRGRQSKHKEYKSFTNLVEKNTKTPTSVPQVRCGPKRDASTINYYSGGSSADDFRTESEYGVAASEASEFVLDEKNDDSYTQTEGVDSSATIEETVTFDDALTESPDYEDAYSGTPVETSEATGLATENLEETDEEVEEEQEKEEVDLSTSKGHTSYGSILIKSDGQQSRRSTKPSEFSSSKRSTVTPSKYSENNYYKRTPVASSIRSSRRSPEASSVPTEMGSSRYRNTSPSGASTAFTNATASNAPRLSSSRASFDSQLSEDIIKTEQYEQKTIDRHKNSTKVYIGIRKFKRKTITHVPRRSKFLHKGVKIQQDRAMRHHDVMRHKQDEMRRHDVIKNHEVIPQQVAPTLHSEPEQLPNENTKEGEKKDSSVTKITKFLDDIEGLDKENKAFIDGQNICKRHANTKLCKRITKSLGTSQSVFTEPHSEDSVHMDMYGDKIDTRQRFPKGLLKMGAMDYSSTNISVITSWWDEGSDGVKRRTGSLEEGMPPRLDSDEDEIRGRDYVVYSSDDTEMPSKSYRGYAAMVYLRGDGLLMKNFRGKKPRKCRSKEELKRNYRHGQHLPPIRSIHCLNTFGRLQISSKIKNLDGDSLHLLCEEPNCLYARCLDSNDFIDHPDGIKCTKWPCKQKDAEPGVTLDDVEFLLERGSKRGSSILDSDSDDPICKFAMKCKRCPERRKFKPFFPGLYDKYAILPMAKKIVDCAILAAQELHGKVYPLYTEEDLEMFSDQLAAEHLETGVARYLSKTAIQCSWLDLQSECTFNELLNEEGRSTVDSSIADELAQRSIDQARRRLIIDAFIKENSPGDLKSKQLGSKYNQVDRCCFSNSNLVSFSTTVPDKDNLPEECFFNQVGNRQVFSRDVGDMKQRLIASFLPTKILAEQIIGKATEGGTNLYMNTSSIYETASSSSFPRITDVFSETSANVKRKYSYTPMSPSHPSYYKTREAVKELLNDLIGAVVIGENLSLNANASRPGAELAYNLSQLVSEQALQNKKKKEKKRSDKIERLAEKGAKDETDKKKQKRPNPPVSKRDQNSDSVETSVDTFVTNSGEISSELSSQEDLFIGSSGTTSETDEYDPEFTPTPSSRGHKIIRIENWSKSSGLFRKAKRVVANSGPPGKLSHDFNNNFPKTLKIRKSKIPKAIKKFFKLMSDDDESTNVTPSSSGQYKKAVTFSDSHLERWKHASSCSSKADCSEYPPATGKGTKRSRSRRQYVGIPTCSSKIDCSDSACTSSSNGFFTAQSDSNQYTNGEETPFPSAGFLNPYEKIRLSKISGKKMNQDSANKVFGNVPKSMMKKFGNIAKHLATTNHNQKKKTIRCEVNSVHKCRAVPFPSSRAACSSKEDTSGDDSDYVIFEFVSPRQLISESTISGNITGTSNSDIGFTCQSKQMPVKEFESSHTSDYASHNVSSTSFSHNGNESNTSSSNHCIDSLQPSGKPRSFDDSGDFHSYETIPDASLSSSYHNQQIFTGRKEVTSSECYFTSSHGGGLKALKSEWNKLKRTKRELADDTVFTSEAPSCSMDLLHTDSSLGLQRKERSFKISDPSCFPEKVTIGNRTERGICPSNNSLLTLENDESSCHLLNKFQTLTSTKPRESETNLFALPSNDSGKSKRSGILKSSLGIDGVAKTSYSKKCPSQKLPVTDPEPMRIISPRDSAVSLRPTDTFSKICDPSKPPLRIIWELSETQLSPYPGTCKPTVGLLNAVPKQHCTTGVELIKSNSKLPIISKTRGQPATLIPTAAPQREIKDLICELNNEMEGVCDIFNSSLVNCTDRRSEIVEHGQFQDSASVELTSAGDIAKMLGDLQSTVLSFFENFKNSASDIFGGSKENELPLRRVTRKRISTKRHSSRKAVTDDSDSSTHHTQDQQFQNLRIGRHKENDSGYDMKLRVGQTSKQKQRFDKTPAVKNYNGPALETSSKISTEAQIRQTGYLIEKTNSRIGNVKLRRYHQTVTATIESSLEEETTSYNSNSEIEDIDVSEVSDDLSADNWQNHDQPHPSSRPIEKKKILHPSCHCVESATRWEKFNELQTQQPLSKVATPPSILLDENKILKENESSLIEDDKEFLKQKIKSYPDDLHKDESFSTASKSTEISAFQEEICAHISERFPRIAQGILQSDLPVASRGVLDSDEMNDTTVKSVTLGTRCFQAQGKQAISNKETHFVDLQTPTRHMHVEKALGTFQQFTPSASTVQKQKEELKSIQFEKPCDKAEKSKLPLSLTDFSCNPTHANENQSHKSVQPKVKALKDFFEDLQPGISNSRSKTSSIVSSAASNGFVKSNNPSANAPPLPPKTLTPSAGSSIVKVEPLESFALTKATEKSEYSVTDSEKEMFVRSVKVSRRNTTFSSIGYRPVESDQIDSDKEEISGKFSRSVKLSYVNPSVSTVTCVPEAQKDVLNFRNTYSSSSLKSVKSTGSPPTGNANVLIKPTKKQADASSSRKKVKITRSPPSHGDMNINIGHGRNIAMPSNLDHSDANLSEISLSSSARDENNQITMKYDRNKARAKYSKNTQIKSTTASNVLNYKYNTTPVSKSNEESPLHVAQYCQTSDVDDDFSEQASSYNICPSAGKTKILRNRGNVTPQVQSAVQINQQIPLTHDPGERKRQTQVHQDPRQTAAYLDTNKSAVPSDGRQVADQKNVSSDVPSQDRKDMMLPSNQQQSLPRSTHKAKESDISQVTNPYARRPSIDIGTRATRLAKQEKGNNKPSTLRDSVQVGRPTWQRTYGPEALKESQTRPTSSRHYPRESSNHHKRFQDIEEDPACLSEKRYSSSDYLDGLPSNLKTASCEQVSAIHGTMKSVAREMDRRSNQDNRPHATGFRPVPAKLGRSKGYPQSQRAADRYPNSRYPYPTGIDTDDLVVGRKRPNNNKNQFPDSKRQTLQSGNPFQEGNLDYEDNEGGVEGSSMTSANQKAKRNRRQTAARMEQMQQPSDKDLHNSKTTRSKSYPAVRQDNKSNTSESNTISASQPSRPEEDDGRWHHSLRNNQNESLNDAESSSPSDRVLKRRHDSDEQNPKSLSVVDFLRGTLDRPLRKAPPQEVTFRPIYRDSCYMDESQNSSKDTIPSREWNMHTKSKEPYYRREGPSRSTGRNETPYHGSHRPTTARSKRSWKLLPSTESLRSLQRFGYNALSNLCGITPRYDNHLSPSTSNSSDISLRPSASRMAVNAATKVVDIAIRFVAVAFILYLVFHEEPFQLGGTSPI